MAVRLAADERSAEEQPDPREYGGHREPGGDDGEVLDGEADEDHHLCRRRVMGLWMGCSTATRPGLLAPRTATDLRFAHKRVAPSAGRNWADGRRHRDRFVQISRAAEFYLLAPTIEYMTRPLGPKGA